MFVKEQAVSLQLSSKADLLVDIAEVAVGLLERELLPPADRREQVLASAAGN